MNAKITFVSAGAGSGKTHRLTTLLHQELESGRVKPSGVMATTFTRKAATELRERVRGFLLDQGAFMLANAMGQARIGTVNAVCGDLLRRFAFEAGLPPEQTVLEEEQSLLLLRHATDNVQDGSQAAALNGLKSRLGIDNWDEVFTQLVSQIRANAITPEQLGAIAKDNADDLLSHLRPAASADLSRQLEAELGAAIPKLRAASSTKKTQEYVEIAEALWRGLRFGDARWSDWVKIASKEPEKALLPLAEPIREIAQQVLAHPGLHQDIREYLDAAFSLAGRVLESYQQIKIDRGVIDFTDQERLLLRLLDDPFVARTFREELDLLMVDEFQDTSPIQLALFLRLAACAKQVYWVGDIKQAIYGFRGSDTELMQAMVKALPALGGTREQLDRSWRSRKPLVDLVNAAFVPAFANTMHAHEVALSAQRSEPLSGPPFGVWHLPGPVAEQNAALGLALQHLVASGYLVHDKAARKTRPVELRDIAILRRSNEAVTATALALRAIGVPAMTEQPGLLATPEAVLARAVLRRLNDPGDTVASAEIISLCDCSEPEVWVTDRLTYLAQGGDPAKWREAGDQAHPILSRLARLREDLPVMSPAEALETAIAEAQLPGVVLRWTASQDVGRVRLANLDAIVAMARQYETVCAGAKHSASLSGLLLWLSEQEKGNTDNLALPAIDAVNVMTHHKAKGLEWPVVVLMDLHGDVKDGLWGAIRAKSRGAIAASDPLRDRTLRYWPWPFGQQHFKTFKDELARTPVAQSFKKIAVEESKRVLYVSMTRARDLMLFALPEKSPTGPWLDTLEAPWLHQVDDEGCMHLPNGAKLPVLFMPELVPTETVTPTQSVHWFAQPKDFTDKLPRTFNPSKADSPSMEVVQSIELGQRMQVAPVADWTDVGHAVHAAMAMALVDVNALVAQEDVSKILTGYGLTAHVSASALVQQISAVRKWVSSTWPGCTTLPEWPVEAVVPSGQVLQGRVDLLIDAGTHWVLVDYKSNPGGSARWEDLANTYGGQQLAYQQAIEAATGKAVEEIWLALPVAGSAIRIRRRE
jgi:ATP-dependent exoDNAse (exonuclease V) beta subunit